jgi:hypothetical protein
MHRYLVFTIYILLPGSCAEQVEKYEYYRFSKHITPNGKYIINDYARYDSMAFSSDVSWAELFKIDEKFAEGERKKNKCSN